MTAPGDIIEGRYRIISTLGEGGMGTVFLAEHTLIKRRVAIKILHPELATDANIVERFLNEARAAGTLGHPNIVESTDMGVTHDHVPYIVFEYLEGALLTDEIYRVKVMPVRRAIRIAQQIASALDAAHAAGIIHRDLKCDNVFLTDKDDTTDHVKVLDFGISRFQHVDERSGGLVMGTPEYMAPEQISDPDGIDSRADIYALGVILYEMLAARRPFAMEDDPRALMTRILSEPPPPLGRPEVPHALAEMIVGKLLAKSPAQRFQSMFEVETALDAFFTPSHGTDGDGARRRKPVPTMEADGQGVVMARRIVTSPRAGSHVQLPPAPAAKRPLALYGLAGAGLLVGVIGIVMGMSREARAPAPVEAGSVAGRAVQPETTIETRPVTMRTIDLVLEANAVGGKVSFRRRVVATPTTLQLAPNTIVEMVEVSAPGRKTMRYWLTLDRPTKLLARLPEGKGVLEATDDEILVALGEMADPEPVAVATSSTKREGDAEKRRAHARARTKRRVGRSAGAEPAPGPSDAPEAPAELGSSNELAPPTPAPTELDPPPPPAPLPAPEEATLR